ICINAAGDELKGRKIEYSQSPILRIFRKNKELPK
ncbi:YihY/virulence factor BrkB family protein, partial [Lactobacillus paragasseri]